MAAGIKTKALIQFLVLSSGAHTVVHGPPAVLETFPRGLRQDVGELQVIISWRRMKDFKYSISTHIINSQNNTKRPLKRERASTVG